MAVFVSGCATNLSDAEWPQEIPDRQLFIDAYDRQVAAGTNTNDLDNHLLWIKRFYQGSLIYPLGWNRISEMFLDSIVDRQIRRDTQQRMRVLGTTIAIEWAQDNATRLIDSAAIATWGNALRTAAERDEQQSFVSKVEADVAAILQGTLTSDKISRERYYPPEDYDNF